MFSSSPTHTQIYTSFEVSWSSTLYLYQLQGSSAVLRSSLWPSFAEENYRASLQEWRKLTHLNLNTNQVTPELFLFDDTSRCVSNLPLLPFEFNRLAPNSSISLAFVSHGRPQLI